MANQQNNNGEAQAEAQAQEVMWSNAAEIWHPASIDTMAKIRHVNQVHPPETIYTIHDKTTSPRYAWLLPGWLAEERRMPSGQIDKCFYDPAGNQYKSQSDVMIRTAWNWEESGIIVID